MGREPESVLIDKAGKFLGTRNGRRLYCSNDGCGKRSFKLTPPATWDRKHGLRRLSHFFCGSDGAAPSEHESDWAGRCSTAQILRGNGGRIWDAAVFATTHNWPQLNERCTRVFAFHAYASLHAWRKGLFLIRQHSRNKHFFADRSEFNRTVSREDKMKRRPCSPAPAPWSPAPRLPARWRSKQAAQRRCPPIIKTRSLGVLRSPQRNTLARWACGREFSVDRKKESTGAAAPTRPLIFDFARGPVMWRYEVRF